MPIRTRCGTISGLPWSSPELLDGFLSHLLLILISMWFSTKRRRIDPDTAAGTAPCGAPASAAGEEGGLGRSCQPCDAALAHCHGTLVLHADGSMVCDEASTCENTADWHQWWLSCTELQPACGCTGDEQPFPNVVARAA